MGISTWSHVLRGLSVALNSICSMQTFADSKQASDETNGTVALRPHWWVLLPDLYGSFSAIDAPQGNGP